MISGDNQKSLVLQSYRCYRLLAFQPLVLNTPIVTLNPRFVSHTVTVKRPFVLL